MLHSTVYYATTWIACAFFQSVVWPAEVDLVLSFTAFLKDKVPLPVRANNVVLFENFSLKFCKDSCVEKLSHFFVLSNELNSAHS